MYTSHACLHLYSIERISPSIYCIAIVVSSHKLCYENAGKSLQLNKQFSQKQASYVNKQQYKTQQGEVMLTCQK